MLEEKNLINTKILKKQTLETMEYLPSNTYIHEAREPVAEKSESDEARAKIEFYSFRNSYRA